MKTLRLMLTLAALLVAIALSGCSDESDPAGADTPAGVDDYAGIDFDAEYGGLTKSDEDPAFGDPYLLQQLAMEEDEAYDDELRDDPQVRAWERMGEQAGATGDPTRPRFTFLRVLWGMLDGPVREDGSFEDGDAVDWSGMLSVDRGVVLVRRVVLFERPYDNIVRPRPDRQTVAWNSHTGPHYDGLVIQIIEPPLDADGDGQTDPGNETPNQLRFETMAFSATWDMAEVADLDEIHPVEPEGNAIHFVGFNLSDLDPCPMGYLAGLWEDDAETADGSGTFRGRWVNLLGIARGHVMGAYGFDEAGEPVFFGKYIDRAGNFMGLLAGHWEPADETGRGEFRGHWINQAETVEGILGGQFLNLPERPRGFFQGRWATDCDEEARAGIED
ncbi:hypothetical protein GF314_11545 [bacterium]|nr:hypothetical protein [bacterium]